MFVPTRPRSHVSVTSGIAREEVGRRPDFPLSLESLTMNQAIARGRVGTSKFGTGWEQKRSALRALSRFSPNGASTLIHSHLD